MRRRMAAAQRAKAILWASECHIQLLDYYYYTALASAAFYDQAPSDGKKELWKLVSEHLEQLKEWAAELSFHLPGQIYSRGGGVGSNGGPGS